MRACARAGQDRFEERWAQQVAPRIAEVDAAAKVEEEALRQRIAEASLRDAAEAAAKAAARLAAHFEGAEARLQDARALAAACCEPALTPDEKARQTLPLCPKPVRGRGGAAAGRPGAGGRLLRAGADAR